MITIKTPQELNIMREGGWLLARILQAVASEVKPGVTTNHLNKVALDLILVCGAKPAFLGYQGFPAALCVSINEEVVHGAPSERKLKQGDIIGLDLGIQYPVSGCSRCPMGASCNPTNKSFFLDAAVTVPVGKISQEAANLLATAQRVLDIAIEKIKPNIHLGDVSSAIQKYVEDHGFSVVRALVGHGIGAKLHEEPEVPNFGKSGSGPVLKEGMTLAIEPMITAGDYRIKLSKDGFAFETIDKSLSAHFEHTVAVVKDGCEVLTKA